MRLTLGCPLVGIITSALTATAAPAQREEGLLRNERSLDPLEADSSDVPAILVPTASNDALYAIEAAATSSYDDPNEESSLNVGELGIVSETGQYRTINQRS